MASPKTKALEKEVTDIENTSDTRTEIVKPEIVKSERESAINLIKDILVLSLTPDDGLSKVQRKEKSEKLLVLVEKLKSL